jgi:prepilin-type N-terminal cleavage/methylation domain-containing protein
MLKIMKINKKAFSLIELSIVILIIGILVAGVTQSSRIINQMRLQNARIITQNSPINSIKDLVIWLETSMEGSFINDEAQEGSTISEWRDNNPLTIQKNKFIQPNAAIRPIYRSSAINNLPGIMFEDSQSSPIGRVLYFPNAVAGDFVATSNMTLFLVATIDSINQSGSSLINWFIAPNLRILTHFIWPDNNIYFDFGYCCDLTSRIQASVNINDYIKNPKIITYFKNGNNLGFRSNGVQLINNNSATSRIPAGSSSSFVIGEGVKGKLAEFIMYNRSLSNDETKDIEQYLAKKWAIKLMN